MTKIRVLIADDHALVREGLRRVLDERADWEVCAEAADGNAAIELALQHRPDVVVLDYSMPGANGLEATRRLREALPDTEVLLLTMHESEALVRDVLAAGARGFLLKSDAGRTLVQAIETLLQHKPFFSANVSELVLQGYLGPSAPAAPPGGALTPREREIVRLVADGRSSKDIARKLGLSPKTVETHRGNILRKLELRSVSDLVRYAVRYGLVDA